MCMRKKTFPTGMWGIFGSFLMVGSTETRRSSCFDTMGHILNYNEVEETEVLMPDLEK